MNIYNLLKYINSGILIHTGRIDSTLRKMLENLFKNEKTINSIFCSSTLINGVNLNSERLIIINNLTDGKRKDKNNLVNLSGRVGRINSKECGEIFVFTKTLFEDFLKKDHIFLEENEKNEKSFIKKMTKNLDKNFFNQEDLNLSVLLIKSQKYGITYSPQISELIEKIELKIDSEQIIKNDILNNNYEFDDYTSSIISIKDLKSFINKNKDKLIDYIKNIKKNKDGQNKILQLLFKYYSIVNDSFKNKISIVFRNFIFKNSLKISIKNYINVITSSKEEYFLDLINNDIVKNKTLLNDSVIKFNPNLPDHMNKFIDFYIMSNNEILEEYIKPFLNIINNELFKKEIFLIEEVTEEITNPIELKVMKYLSSLDLNSSFTNELFKKIDFSKLENEEFNFVDLAESIKDENYRDIFKLIFNIN